MDPSGLLALQRAGRGSEWRFSQPNQIGPWPLLLREDVHRGRYVVAKDDLEAGALLCSEEPFVQCVHDALQDEVCHVCYGLLRSAKGTMSQCTSCGQVRYCSPACAQEGKAAHAAECGVLCAIAANSNETLKRGVRGLRLFIRLVHRAHAEPEAFAAAEAALSEHYSTASPERRRFMEQMAMQINKMVPAEVRMESGRLARLVSRVHTNLHAVSDMAGVQYGSALYPSVGMLFNHSCDPSASSSFLGRTWRLHALKPIAKGEEVSIAYTELYAGPAERQAALKAKKAFECACSRCTQPPPSDAELDGWTCTAEGRACHGGVPPSVTRCVACNAVHKLAPEARAAIEQRWRGIIDEGMLELQSKGSASDAGVSSAGERRVTPAQVTKAVRACEQVLTQSRGKLFGHHTLRHKAYRLQVYALNCLPSIGAGACDAAVSLVNSIEECLKGFDKHMPQADAHPEVAFFRHWRAKALWKRAEAIEANASGGMSGAARASAKRLRERASEVAQAAANCLATSYGHDHPTVATWRALSSAD
jgi:hypothetical protein